MLLEVLPGAAVMRFFLFGVTMIAALAGEGYIINDQTHTITKLLNGQKELIAADAELKSANDRLMNASQTLQSADAELRSVCNELATNSEKMAARLHTFAQLGLR